MAELSRFHPDGSGELPQNKTIRFDRKSGQALRIARAETAESDEGELPLHAPSIFTKAGDNTDLCERFSFRGMIGEGATARIYALHDRNCGREIAVKVPKFETAAEYPAELARFIQEAHISSELEHPSIVPIYDLEMDDQGQIYLSMRKVEGYTLKEYIDLKLANAADDRVKSMEDLILVFLKICEALSYAHSKERVHQDIKPENIMIGDFGEVFVIDWGASSCMEDEISVTPIYMSPQQASGLMATSADDVFCIGSTFFHCLTLRFPTSASTLDELIERRKRGEIDPLTDKELATVPSRLLAIALKAMALEPEGRYQSVAELAQDLKNYQQGLAVSAYTDSISDYIMRWYRRHKHIVWSTAAILTVLAISGGLLYRYKLKEIAYWGAPVYTEDFSDDSWKKEWIAHAGEFKVRKGELITVGRNLSYYLINLREFNGSVAIEFDGRFDEGAPPGDLTIVWFDDIRLNPTKDKIVHEHGRMFLQVGGFGNTCAMIKLALNPMDLKKFSLESGRTYRIRGEFDNTSVRLLVDGKLLCEGDRTFARRSGYVGLYGFDHGKIFDNVRIYEKGVAEKVTVTSIADSHFLQKNFEAALREYSRIARSFPGRNLAHEATYKSGLCLYELERKSEAYRLWDKVRETDLEYQTWKHYQQRLFDAGRHDEVRKNMRDYYLSGSPKRRKEVLSFWGHCANMIRMRHLYEEIPAYLQVRREAFPNETLLDYPAGFLAYELGDCEQILRESAGIGWVSADVLVDSGRYQECLDKFSHLRGFAVRSLAALGRHQEALAKYPERREYAAQEAIRQGDFQAALSYNHPGVIALIQHEQGRGEEALKLGLKRGQRAVVLRRLGRLEEHIKKHPQSSRQLLLDMGRYEQALRMFPGEKYPCAHALIQLGRLDEAIERYPTSNALGWAYLRKGEFDKIFALRGMPWTLGWQALLLMGKEKLAVERYNRHFYSRGEVSVHTGETKAFLDRVVTRYSYKVPILLERGDTEAILRDYGKLRSVRAKVLLLEGRYDEILRDYKMYRATAVRALEAKGRYQEMLAYPEYREQIAWSLLRQGKHDELMKDYKDMRHPCAVALIAMDRAEEVQARYREQHYALIQAQAYLALKEAESGDSGKARARIAAIPPLRVGYTDHRCMFAYYLMPAFLTALDGKSGWVGQYRKLARLKHVYSGKMAAMASYVLGDIDNTQFLKQPAKALAQSRLLLCKAMKAELTQQAAALANYQAYAKLPANEKECNPVTDRFVRWRIKVLSKK